MTVKRERALYLIGLTSELLVMLTVVAVVAWYALQ